MKANEIYAKMSFTTVVLAITLSARLALGLPTGENDASASVEPQAGMCSVICPLPGEAPGSAESAPEKMGHLDATGNYRIPGVNLTTIGLK